MPLYLDVHESRPIAMFARLACSFVPLLLAMFATMIRSIFAELYATPADAIAATKAAISEGVK